MITYYLINLTILILSKTKLYTQLLHLMNNFILLLSLLFQVSYCQTYYQVEDALQEINSMAQFEAFKTKHKGWFVETKTIPISDSIKTPEVEDAQVGDVFRQNYGNNPRILTKVLAVKEVEQCRVQYIFLDGREKSFSEIEKLRIHILHEFKKGTPFISLVKQYSMDGSQTGDTGWFLKGKMAPEFEKAVWKRSQGSIFFAEVPSRKWYFVVYKTHANRKECAIECVSVDFDFQ